MSARLLDGKGVAKAIREEVKRGVSELVAKGVRPGLAAILVGENPASEIYVRNKTRASEEAGIHSETLRLAADTAPSVLAGTIDALNRREDVDAILLQLPLPSHLDPGEFIPCIHPDKDVDGFHPINVGRLVQNDPGPRPCTPAGIMELLRREKIEINGARAAVLGRSNIVGKPMALLLLHEHATVTICHSRTRELAKVASEADILVAAMGRPGFVRGDFVRPGATVIDVGINREEGKIVGDVDFEGVKDKVSAITPVPGGVGPMTIALLLRNTLTACKNIERFPSAQAGREHSS